MSDHTPLTVAGTPHRICGTDGEPWPCAHQAEQDWQCAEVADRLSELLRMGIPRNMTYTRKVIGECIRELRGESPRGVGA